MNASTTDLRRRQGSISLLHRGEGQRHQRVWAAEELPGHLAIGTDHGLQGLLHHGVVGKQADVHAVVGLHETNRRTRLEQPDSQMLLASRNANDT